MISKIIDREYILTTMIKFTQKIKTILHFDLKVEGKVKQSDVIGSLLTFTSAAHDEYNITKLQNEKKIGKIEINLDFIEDSKQVEGISRGILTIPLDLDSYEASILVAVIEQSVTKVNVFKAIFRLKEVEEVDKINYQKILKRALEVYNLHYGKKSEEYDLKKILVNLTSKNKATEVGSFTFGSTFKDSPTVFIVEGRRDVLVLGDYGYSNVLAVGGFEFDETALWSLIENKEVILFLDGDVGGKALRNKLVNTIDPKYEITTPNGLSVENLKKSQIYELVQNKKLL